MVVVVVAASPLIFGRNSRLAPAVHAIMSIVATAEYIAISFKSTYLSSPWLAYDRIMRTAPGSTVSLTSYVSGAGSPSMLGSIGTVLAMLSCFVRMRW